MQGKFVKGAAIKILSRQPIPLPSKYYISVRKYHMRKKRCVSTTIVLNEKIGSKIIIGVTNDAPNFCMNEVKKDVFR